MMWNERTFYELLRVVTCNQKWLDIGCGRPVRSPELARVRAQMREGLFVGVDRDRASLRSRQDRVVEADATHLPFPDGYFGVVSSDMVFEHLENPALVLIECWRVLQQDGVLLIHTACSLHYLLLGGRMLKAILSESAYRGAVSRFTGRRQEDIFPTRYQINTRAKLARAIEAAGFNAGLVAALETPDRAFRLGKYVPHNLKSSLLAMYFKAATKRPMHLVRTEETYSGVSSSQTCA
jgi:ubiquinone/menaquinone biosynthesis C-methylase UbiE